MSGRTCFDKPVSLAALCRGEISKIIRGRDDETTELSGLERRHRKTRCQTKKEMASKVMEIWRPPDWRERARPGNKPMQKEGRKQSNLSEKRCACWEKPVSTSPNKRASIHQEAPQLPWTTCKQRNSVANAQTIAEESVTCIAVKEDRHQNIMSSVALEKSVEEAVRE